MPGIEVAGRIRAVGEGVSDLAPGQPVAALTIVDGGGYAEVTVTSADLVVPLDDLGMDCAAALPSNSTTAFLVLDRVARIEPGQSVLVHAAAGGVGSQLGQAARLLGAGRVVGTVGSAAKIETARDFGYGEVILRDRLAGAGEFDIGEFDIVVDVVGGPARRASLDRLAPMGRLVVMGNASGADDVGVPANELWFTNRTVSGFNLAAFAAAFPQETGRALRRAVAAAAKGDRRVRVETLPVSRAVEFHRRIEAGVTTGKPLLGVAAGPVIMDIRCRTRSNVHVARIRPMAALLGSLLVTFGVFTATPASGSMDPETAYVDVAVATAWVSPGLNRPVDAPAVANPVDIRAWTGTMTLAQRADLVGNLETQALFGNPVKILERKDGWAHVAVVGQPTPREALGYPGWVPARQIISRTPGSAAFGALQGSRPFAMVTAPTAWLSKDAAGRRHDMEISADTRLPVLARTPSAVRVATPDRGDRWLAARDVHVYATAASIPRPTGAELVRTAKMFAGLHYLWAGTSGFGFDCSGFTHTVYDLNGITIPRDATAQKTAGTPVAKDALQPGDLIFYAYDHGTGSVHHTGMYIGDGYEIDAPANSATVESPLEIVKVDEHRYADQYAGAVRFL